MGKINGCLKAVVITFNVLFTCLGGMLIYGLIKIIPSNHEMQGIDAPSVVWVWLFAICTVLIGLLGTHAARTENKCGLKLFAVLMGIGMVLMVIFGFLVAASKKQTMDIFRSPEVAKEFLNDDGKKQLLETLQKELHCCGWTGVEDWSPNVPDSCHCTSSHDECKSSPQGRSSVYSKSCGEIVGDYVEYGIKIALGVLFGFAFIAMMGLIISANMINQINRHDREQEQEFLQLAY